jgi:flavin reductase (DIM6/NTAB) family NADH-FMN oxidoreductase RutF
VLKERTPCIRSVRLRHARATQPFNFQSVRSFSASSQSRQDEGEQLTPSSDEQPRTPLVKKIAPQEAPLDLWAEDEESTNCILAQVGPEALGNTVRDLMRQVPSSVAIITAAHIDPKLNKSVPLGIAVSSFNTVTLDPPHISFNIKCPSTTLDAMRNATGLFRLHLLSCSQKSAHIVDYFAKGNNPESYSLREYWVPMFLPRSRFEEAATESAAPQIRGPTVVAALECQLTQEVTVADHVIVVAKVNSLVRRPELQPTLLYHDGAYKRTNGTVLSNHQTAPKSNQTKLTVGKCWKYPLFPGEAERDDLLAYIKTYIQGHSRLFDLPINQATKVLKRSLGLPSCVFGIDLSQVIARCRVESGLDSGLRPYSVGNPQVFDFHGRLTPGQIAAIVERARKLVLADPISLSLPYREFFSHLGISLEYCGLLASDILDRLRTESLVAPFEQQARTDDSASYLTIESLENIEFKLSNFMKTKPYREIYRMTSVQLQHQIEEPNLAEPYIRLVRDRLIVEAFPSVFDKPYIDIKGELTLEEVRVFVNRVIRFIALDNLHGLRRRIRLPRVELLRRIGLHPLISGVDPSFLFDKLSFLSFQCAGFREFPLAVDEMLTHMFEKKTFTWAELESRVRAIVQKHTLHAVKWSRDDFLAAMGVDHRAKMKTPLSDSKPHIIDGHLLPTLIAKELKNHYGNGTHEENVAIKAFLKSQYNYEIAEPSSSSPSDSAEELHEAMLRGLNVNVLNKDRSKMELREALNIFARKKPAESVTNRKGDGPLEYEVDGKASRRPLR